MANNHSSQARKNLSPAHQDYLKAIYTLRAQGHKGNNSALAHHLDVTPASTTNMVKRLADLNLVSYHRYREIGLTEEGERLALEVLRHHRLLELYLHQKLNLAWDQVHAEAERLEHHISDALEDAIATALDNPTIDPHGDPIPTKDGHVGVVTGESLTVAELNRPYRLVRVLVQDTERLSYLGTLGLFPGAEIMLLKRAPFAGPLLVDVAGEHHALAHEMAELLLVTAI